MDNNEIEMQNTTPEVKWNDEVRLIVSDVDETIADNYTSAEPEMIKELTTLLGEGKVLFTEANLPITPRLGGMWAIDFAIKGVNKTTAVKYVLNDEAVLQSLGLTPEDVRDPKKMEIWGDRFSTLRGGTDRHMCEALPKQVRAIDFREENPAEFPEGYNVVLWSRKQHVHNGLLEYLQSRHE